MSENNTYCGRIVIAGRPNVGKSTLLNRILGVHLAATTSKPQTTRNRILGIHTDGQYQMVFVDTPGIHDDKNRVLNRRLNKTAVSTLPDADVLLFLVEAGNWTPEDERVLKYVINLDCPVVLVVNKIDRIKDKAELMPYLQQTGEKYHFSEIIPISAFSEKNVRYLLQQLKKKLKQRDFEFEEDELTDRNMRFVAAELIREQLTQSLGQELPYSITVDIERYVETGSRVEISALIYVARDSQKSIVIGKQGAMLKKIGQEARQRIRGLLGQPVHLELWVKVKRDWMDKSALVDSMLPKD